MSCYRYILWIMNNALISKIQPFTQCALKKNQGIRNRNYLRILTCFYWHLLLVFTFNFFTYLKEITFRLVCLPKKILYLACRLIMAVKFYDVLFLYSGLQASGFTLHFTNKYIYYIYICMQCYVCVQNKYTLIYYRFVYWPGFTF